MIGIALSLRQLIAVRDVIFLTPKRSAGHFQFSGIVRGKSYGESEKESKIFTGQKHIIPRR